MKRKILMIVLAALVLSIGTVGCGNNETNTGSNTQEEAKEDTCKVTFYDSDGKTELKTLEVKSGECAEEYVPEKEGFVGWFATPQMSHRFDFSTPITEDTQV